MEYLYAINIQHIPLNYYVSLAKSSEQKQVRGLVWFFFFLLFLFCLLNAG